MTQQKKTDNNGEFDRVEPTLNSSGVTSDVDEKITSEESDVLELEEAQITTTDEEVANLQGEVATLQEEAAKLKDAFLRSKAEEDNVRRRAEKDISNSRKFAVEGFAKELLGVYDSLKLAVAVDLTEDSGEAVKSVQEGVNITLKQLQSAFTKFSLSEISPEVGDKLDPNLHQAMSMVESEEVASGCILSVIQLGFQLHDRLLRPAMVVVAK